MYIYKSAQRCAPVSFKCQICYKCWHSCMSGENMPWWKKFFSFFAEKFLWQMYSLQWFLRKCGGRKKNEILPDLYLQNTPWRQNTPCVPLNVTADKFKMFLFSGPPSHLHMVSLSALFMLYRVICTCLFLLHRIIYM